MSSPRASLGLRLLPAPLLFPAEAASARERALREADPDTAWEAYRQARRASGSLPFRALGAFDDLYRTDAPELLDRADTPPERRRHLLERLDLFHRRMGSYPTLVRLVTPLLADRSPPRVLEIAGGHGQLAIALEDALRAAGRDPEVIGSDLMPELVALAESNAAAAGSRATFRVLDATRLDLPDDAVDLALNAYAAHHLPFGLLVRALAELRRVASRAVIVDLARSPVLWLPGGALVGALTGSSGCVHDGMLSLRKAWGVEAWLLAIALSGWPRWRLGHLPPATLVVQLERD